MREQILELIIRLTDYEELRADPGVNLIEEDILDSLAFIELIEELESRFDIEIQPTQASPDTWNTVDGIANLVCQLTNQRK